MALSDTRSTVLQIVNRVRRKLGVPNDATSLTNDDQTKVMVDLLNDVINEINDFGLWQDMISEQVITLVDGQDTYSLSNSIPVKTVKDIYNSSNNSPLTFISVEEMRLLKRANQTTDGGNPRMFTFYGLDSFANPIIMVHNTPNAASAGQTLNVLIQKMPTLYTTNDASTIVTFPSKLVEKGLEAAAILDEENGSPSDHYSRVRLQFEFALKETFNRLKIDVGYSRKFKPGSRWRA